MDDDKQIVLRFDTAGQVSNRYLNGPAVDMVLADEQLDPGTGTVDHIYWPLTDNLGTVRDLAEYDEASGITAIANHIQYDAFGGVTSETNAAVDTLFGYTGRESDAESDLYYYRARYYDPALGQFASEDPLGFEAKDPNLRRYVGNGPVDAVDPSGLEEKTPAELSSSIQNAHYSQFGREHNEFSDALRRRERHWLAVAVDKRDVARWAYYHKQRVEAALRAITSSRRWKGVSDEIRRAEFKPNLWHMPFEVMTGTPRSSPHPWPTGLSLSITNRLSRRLRRIRSMRK